MDLSIHGDRVAALACNVGGDGFAPHLRRYFRDLFLESIQFAELIIQTTLITFLIMSSFFLVSQSERVTSFHHWKRTEDRVICAVTSADESITSWVTTSMDGCNDARKALYNKLYDFRRITSKTPRGTALSYINIEHTREYYAS